MADIDMVDTETLAAACRTAAVSSAFADLLNAAAARLLAMQSWIDGAKVDMAAMEESLCGFSEEWHSRIIAERNEVSDLAEKAIAWHMEALDDLAACVAERDDWRRRYEALRDGVTGLTEDEWGSRADETERCPLCRRKWSKHTDYDGRCYDGASTLAGYIRDLRAVVARVEET